GVLWVDARRAGGAALRVRLADDDGPVAQLGKRRHDLERARDIGRLLLAAHLDAPLDDLRASFGMEADVVERRAGLAGRVVRAGRAVLEEPAQELGRLRTAWAGRVRAADAGAGQRALDRIGRVIVKAVVLLRSPAPVLDVRLVPDFPVP